MGVPTCHHPTERRATHRQLRHPGRKSENEWEADIDYELAPGHWDQGYATETARAIVAYGFRELGLHRVSSWYIAENAASARGLEKAGLRPEGRWWDTLLYGLLESEWRAAGAMGLR